MGHDATRRKRALLAVLGGCLAGAALLAGCVVEPDYYEAGTVHSPPEVAVPEPQQLEQLVAPIALCPEPLVAQMLTVATYPAEITEADRAHGRGVWISDVDVRFAGAGGGDAAALRSAENSAFVLASVAQSDV